MIVIGTCYCQLIVILENMKQYRLQPGRSCRIYYLLFVNDDGSMELEFHGTDRTLKEKAYVNEGGWILSGGSMYPSIGHPNGRWKLFNV